MKVSELVDILIKLPQSAEVHRPIPQEHTREIETAYEFTVYSPTQKLVVLVE